MSDFLGSAGRTSEGFTEITQARLIADLKAARVQAGVTCEVASKILGMSREVFDDVEAGRIVLNLSEVREYAFAVGAVIEYAVTSKLPETIKSKLRTNRLAR